MLPLRSRNRVGSDGAAALLGFAALTTVTALAGMRSTRKGLSPWYEALRKPAFQPPARVFAPTWTLLYGLIATSGFRVYRKPRSVQRQRALRLWGAQLAFNGVWSWLFFAERRPRAALADCVVLLATAGAYVKVANDVDPLAAKLFVPYVGWLGFATVLNEEIVRLNPSVHRVARRRSISEPPGARPRAP